MDFALRSKPNASGRSLQASRSWRRRTFRRSSRRRTATRPSAHEYSGSAARICTRRSLATGSEGQFAPMRFRIIWTGKTRDARLRALIEDYAGRLSHFVRCEVTELKEPGRTDKTGIDRETRRISDALRSGSLAVLLDPEGAEWTSHELAAQVKSWE